MEMSLETEGNYQGRKIRRKRDTSLEALHHLEVRETERNSGWEHHRSQAEREWQGEETSVSVMLAGLWMRAGSGPACNVENVEHLVRMLG